MPNIYYRVFLLTLIASIYRYHSHAQLYPAIGSYFLYQNEGIDTTIKKIKIYRAYDTFWTKSSNASIFKEYHFNVKGDSSLYKTHKLYVNSPNFGIRYFKNVKDSTGAKSMYDFVRKGDGDMFYTTDVSEDTLKDYWSIIDSFKILKFNGRDYWTMYTQGKFNDSNDCHVLCGPIVVGIGPLGFFFPLNVCKQDTIYAGKLLEFYSSATGVIKIPDSLYSSGCSYRRKNSSVAFPSYPHEVKLYPNPANDILHIYWPNSPARFNIQIYNMHGDLIRSYTSIKDINIQDIRSGLYLLVIGQQNEMPKTFKFSKL